MEGSGSGSGSRYGVSPPEINTPPLTVEAITDSQQVEVASPISSRPPAPSSLNYQQLMRLSTPTGAGQVGADDDALRAAVGEEADRSGGGGGGGNRWPRQETLALLKIRSDMDTAFRDATLKGPLWEEVSRKLAELGYGRSGKKCKEKFENVQKYYKRTKEGRGGRQDGKTYKFFSELEALHSANVAAPTTVGIITSSQLNAATPVSVTIGINNPIPISSVKISSQTPMGIFSPADHFTVRPALAAAPAAVVPPLAGVSFSSDTESSSTGTDDDDNDDDDDFDGVPLDVAGTSTRKRRRGESSSKGTPTPTTGSRTHRMMMEFFEGLMKQVMQKQEVMQQRFLEAIEKREQDRMVREETWKRQEMARLSREQERMAQERAVVASRDAAIIAFLQKFTGQNIQLPQQINIPSSAPQKHDHVPVAVAVTVPMPPSPVPMTPTPPPPPTQFPQQQNPYQIQEHDQSPNTEMQLPQSNILPLATTVSLEPRLLPYQESNAGAGDGSSEPASSRWPKPEVLALIKIRGGLEFKYQESGPKGPLWEEISAAMQRMGYKRSSKRCKEKWENINKYFKKVKESNKKRREDSKTCPYFEELDALYRKKNLGGSDGSGGSGSKLEQDLHLVQQEHIDVEMEIAPSTVIPLGSDADTQKTIASSSPSGLSASLFGEGAEDAATKPEDIVNELMELQDLYRQQQHPQQLMVNEYDKVEEEPSSEEEEEDYCSDEEESAKRNIDNYKINFQRRNVANSNGVGSEFPSMAVVQ